MASVFEVMAKLSANTANFDAGMAKAEQSVEKISRASEKTANKSGRAFAALGKGVLGVFAVTAAAVGGVLAKGVGRLVQIDEAKAKLIGLGNTTESVSMIMDNALSAVRGTAFGMGEAATVAAAAVAAGIEPGAELSGYLTTVADTAYIAGASMQEMGYLLNKATTAGKANNEVLGSLAGRGIPIYEMLGETVGKTSEEIVAMAAKGQISADMLQEALVNKIGGAAQKSGETVQGALANMNAAFQRVGANMAGPALEQFTGFFQEVIGAMGPLEERAKAMGEEIGASLEPIMGSLIDIFMPLVELVFDLITPLLKLIDAFKPLFDTVAPVAALFGEIVKKLIPPFVKIVGVLSKVVADLVLAFLPIIEKILPTFTDYLENYVVPLIEQLGRFISEFLIPIFGFLADKILSAVMPVLDGLVQVMSDFLIPALTAFVDFVVKHLPAVLHVFETVFDAIGVAVMWVWNNVLKPVFGAIFDFLGIDMSAIGASFQKGFNKVKIKPFEHMALEAKITKPAAEALGKSVGTTLGTSLGNATSAAIAKADPFAEFIAGLEDSVMKVGARIRLQGMGFTDGLIGAILGSSDWQTVFNQVVGGSKKALQSIKDLYNKTEAGISELEDAVRTAEDALEDLNRQLADYVSNAEQFNKKLQQLFASANPFKDLLEKRGEFERNVADTFTGFYEQISEGLKSSLIDDAVAEELSLLTARYEQQLSTIAKRVDQINNELADLLVIRQAAREYQQGMRAILEATLPLARVEVQVGRFEAQVVNSFDAINSKIEDGLNIGLFSETVAAQLRATANQTRSTVMAIAKQRDALAITYDQLVDRLHASRDFREATKNAILGVANITTIGKSARTMIRSLSKTLDQTNTFRDQLATLQTMGLNKTAFNQIVNSGLDAGTATAKALLRGGPEAVNEINSLFTNLEVSANALATDAEMFMFDGGEQTIRGFIDGVIAQDELLREAAFNEATAFNTTFQNTIDASQANLNATIGRLEGERDGLVSTATMLATAFANEFQGIIDAAFARAQALIARAQAQAASAVGAANAAVANATAAATIAATVATGTRITTTSGGGSTTSGAPTPSVPTRVNTTTLAGVLAASGPSYSVTVNAGMGSNGVSIGQTIVDEIKKFERQSGRVFIPS